MDQSYLVYDCKLGSFNFTAGKITTWKSTGIFNYFGNSNMNSAVDSGGYLPVLKNDGRMHVYLNGNHFQQNKVIIPNNNNVINIYCVYQIEPISSSRDDTFTVQNALFGTMQITKNADTSKYKYKGYGICFGEDAVFRIGNINNRRNVLIFGVNEHSVIHTNNKANNIFIMGDGFAQGINDTTLYIEKMYSQNFTQPSKKFILSLHYNGNDSYLFVNGKQELKLKWSDQSDDETVYESERSDEHEINTTTGKKTIITDKEHENDLRIILKQAINNSDRELMITTMELLKRFDENKSNTSTTAAPITNTKTPNWLIPLKCTVNSENNKKLNGQSFKYAIAASKTTGDKKSRLINIKKHLNRFNFEGIRYPPNINDYKTFENNNTSIKLIILKESSKEKRLCIKYNDTDKNDRSNKLFLIHLNSNHYIYVTKSEILTRKYVINTD